MALETRRGYRPDHESFGRFLLSDQALDPVKEAAEDIKTLAVGFTPRGRRTVKGKKALWESFKVVQQKTPWVNATAPKNPRRIMRVENDAPHAAAVEFGNRARKAVRMLGKAGALVGEIRSNREV